MDAIRQEHVKRVYKGGLNYLSLPISCPRDFYTIYCLQGTINVTKYRCRHNSNKSDARGTCRSASHFFFSQPDTRKSLPQPHLTPLLLAGEEQPVYITFAIFLTLLSGAALHAIY